MCANTATLGVPPAASPVRDHRAPTLPSPPPREQVPWYTANPQQRNSPTAWLTDEGFLRYATITIWVTNVVTGIGMELVIGEPMIAAIGHSNAVMQFWKFAQLLFSLFITIALFSQSPFGYPFMVIGFWKLGFPETVGNFRRAFRIGFPDSSSEMHWHARLEALGAYLNGMGTFIHHSTGAYLIVCVSTHIMPLDRRILACSLPLVMQHIVVLTRYVNTYVYGVIELFIEIWFEWEIFSNLPDIGVANGYDISCRGTCIAMLFAHWCYWGAAFTSIPKMMGYGVESAESALAKTLSDDGQMVCATARTTTLRLLLLLALKAPPNPLDRTGL